MASSSAKTAPMHLVTNLSEDHRTNPDYSPEKLLDVLLDRFKLKNDAALARALQLPPTVVSKLRSKSSNLSAAVLLRLHDATGLSINDIRSLMNVQPSVPVLQAQ